MLVKRQHHFGCFECHALQRQCIRAGVPGGKSKNYACTARGSRYLDCPQAAVLVSKSAVSHCVPELLAVTRETQSPQAACSLSRPLSTDAHHHCIGIPAALSPQGVRDDATTCNLPAATACDRDLTCRRAKPARCVRPGLHRVVPESHRFRCLDP